VAVEVLAALGRLQRNHEIEIVGSGIPRHAPGITLSGVPTIGASVISGSEVMVALTGCTKETLLLTGDAA
jgi:hypothetical protein